jgi:AIR synthase related protein, C-terminal domain
MAKSFLCLSIKHHAANSTISFSSSKARFRTRSSAAKAIGRRWAPTLPRDSRSRPTNGSTASLLDAAPDLEAIIIEGPDAIPTVQMRGFCEILGLDPLYLANEGKIVVVAPPEYSDNALAALREHPLGSSASVIGTICEGEAGRVTMLTAFGGKRIVDMLVGEQLPRIC